MNRVKVSTVIFVAVLFLLSGCARKTIKIQPNPEIRKPTIENKIPLSTDGSFGEQQPDNAKG